MEDNVVNPVEGKHVVFTSTIVAPEVSRERCIEELSKDAALYRANQILKKGAIR